ncbi:MAG: hypothetical protein HYY84_17270 [Deltaproteobacteria bacterium]|nr:hypothetical protein [Deltaproteobacteria bacterium]
MSPSRTPILPAQIGPFEEVEPLAPCPAAILARARDPVPRLVKVYRIEPVQWFESARFTPLPCSMGEGAVRVVDNRVTQSWAMRAGEPVARLRRVEPPPLGVALALVVEMTQIARAVIAEAPDRPGLLHVSNLWLGADARLTVIDSVLVDWELTSAGPNTWDIPTTGKGDAAIAAVISRNAAWLTAGDTRICSLLNATSLDALDRAALHLLGLDAASARARLEAWLAKRRGASAPVAAPEPASAEDFNAKAQRSKDAGNETSSLGASAPLRQIPAPVTRTTSYRPSPATVGLAILLAATALAGFFIYDALSPDLPTPTAIAADPSPNAGEPPQPPPAVATDAAAASPPSPTNPPPPRREPRIAVIRFRNLTGDLRWSWCEDGFPELVATAIAETNPAFVVETTTLRAALAKAGLAARAIDDASVLAAGRSHNATHAVTGSVARDAKGFLLTVNLTALRGPTQREEWRIPMGDAKDAIQAAPTVARNVVARVAPAAPASASAPAPAPATASAPAQLTPLLSTNPDALVDFIRGRDALARLDVTAALSNFERAVTKDPAFASAHVGLADALVTPWPFNERDRAERALAYARDAEKRLLARDRARRAELTRLLATPDAPGPRDVATGKLLPAHPLALLAAGEHARRRGDFTAALSAWRIAARTLAPARAFAANLALRAVDPHHALRILALRAPGEPETFPEAQFAILATIMANDFSLARKRLRALAHDAARPAAARAWAASAAAELEILLAKKNVPTAAPLPAPDNVTVSYAFTAPRALLATVKPLIARGEAAKAKAALERVVSAWEGSKGPAARDARALLKKLVRRP